MDLPLYLRVLWRFRILALAGFLLAIGLGVFSYARVGFDGAKPTAEYRQPETYSSTATIFITQPGFPLGRAIYDDVVRLGGEAVVPRYSEPSRFASYSTLLARLAVSEPVREIMLQDGLLPGNVSATPARDSSNTASLPLVEISGLATSPQAARVVAMRATRALIRYVAREQQENRISPDRRVILQILNEPGPGALVAPRSRTRPVFIFAASILAVLGLVFVLENLRPRIRVVASEEGGLPPAIDAQRRSA